MKKYDSIVIGAGSGGLNVAVFMANIGLQTLLIEKTDQDIGGDCLNFGCVPSKALIHIAQQVYAGTQSQRFGMNLGGEIDWAEVKDYITRKKDEIREHENADYFRNQGLDVVLGEARLTGRQSVSVGEEDFQAKNIILATGSYPRKLDIPGIEKLEYGLQYHDNLTIFDAPSFPKKLIVIGGGPIGVELGQAFSRLGAQVTILQRGDRLIPRETEAASGILYDQLMSEGLDIRLATNPVGVLSESHLKVESEDGKSETLEFDAILVSIGRELRTIEGCDLAGIGLTERGNYMVKPTLQTTNPHIYVIGDAVGGPQFTHTAELQAQVLLKNLFSPFKKSVSYDTFSWVTYTSPEIATFGQSEEGLKDTGISYQVEEIDIHHEDRQLLEESQGFLRLYIAHHKILGGTMVGDKAGELVQELILAMHTGLKIDDIFSKTYPYPTATRINKALIRTIMARKLTSQTQWGLRLLYRVFG